MSVRNEANQRSDVIGHVIVTPDPAFIKSIGTHHTLESAMADLVDNSIDAGATKVTIKFLTADGHLTGIVVVDDGAGMDGPLIDRAMRLGGQRKYLPGELGHFGVGLKAAALGSADVLAVWSRKRSATPVGRRIRKVDLQKDYSCEVLSPEAAERALDGVASGTVVELSEVKAGVHGDSATESTVWLATVQHTIRQHLGLVYHRLLAHEKIAIDTVEIDEGWRPGSSTPVVPIDPFNYPITGKAGYPHTLRARADGTDVEIRCYIWPPRYTNNSEYRLLQRPAEELQGFYVYRADRLLQIGGWNNVTNPSPTRRLARVAIDVDSLDKLVQLNPEKSGTQFLPEMARAINRAKSSKSITFPDFLTAAEDVHTASKKRRHRRARVVQPAQGFSPGVRKAIASELLFNTSEEPVSVKWRRMTLGKFFDIDREEQTLWLNLAYRDLFSPDHKGMNDAPMIKTLMFLLTQGHFTGVQYSAAKKDDAAVWQALLGAAAEQEASRQRRQKKNS